MEIRSKVVTARLSHPGTLFAEMGRLAPYFSPGGAFHAIAALVFAARERAHLKVLRGRLETLGPPRTLPSQLSRVSEERPAFEGTTEQRPTPSVA
jgi:hypothetical protein